MFYKQIQVAMLPSFANLVTEALPLELRIQQCIGQEPERYKFIQIYRLYQPLF
jgi:hypothetical protein